MTSSRSKSTFWLPLCGGKNTLWFNKKSRNYFLGFKLIFSILSKFSKENHCLKRIWIGAVYDKDEWDSSPWLIRQFTKKSYKVFWKASNPEYFKTMIKKTAKKSFLITFKTWRISTMFLIHSQFQTTHFFIVVPGRMLILWKNKISCK